VKNGFNSVNDQRVTCVGSTLVAHNHVGFFCEHVNEFTFAFIAPLGADYNNTCHEFSPEKKDSRTVS
jgi:hypothetical protein